MSREERKRLPRPVGESLAGGDDLACAVGDPDVVAGDLLRPADLARFRPQPGTRLRAGDVRDIHVKRHGHRAVSLADCLERLVDQGKYDPCIRPKRLSMRDGSWVISTAENPSDSSVSFIPRVRTRGSRSTAWKIASRTCSCIPFTLFQNIFRRRYRIWHERAREYAGQSALEGSKTESANSSGISSRSSSITSR